jgi:hypothetical protein
MRLTFRDTERTLTDSRRAARRRRDIVAARWPWAPTRVLRG